MSQNRTGSFTFS